jgi:hypothetical protein
MRTDDDRISRLRVPTIAYDVRENPRKCSPNESRFKLDAVGIVQMAAEPRRR